ncbi:AraC family transcriptional regulator [Crenobacter sp. SG2303]|uniref:AraC family transcriptional regulator n=1 Tax=Crenobacter oryzisoli TaxID=3056844 RepID=A0ABT7XS99_9NEIS|nr:AraC family transcriptional regulator [Crenobacter sp. SG2303]MDN0076665.1 AraC family transcriptional regulator [Crenobacter sp. SG2303]
MSPAAHFDGHRMTSSMPMILMVFFILDDEIGIVCIGGVRLVLQPHERLDMTQALLQASWLAPGAGTGRGVARIPGGVEFMTPNALAMLCQGDEQRRPETIEELLAGMAPLLPMLDVIPNAAIFIKDVQARYLNANRTLVQRCGLKQLQPLLGKTSAEVFPAQLGPGYTEQDRRVLEQGLVLEHQLELHLYKSREPGWCLTYKWPLYNRNGEIIGLMGVSVDLQSASNTHPAYQRLVAVDEYIRANFNLPITMDELTRIAGISAAQLERYCKRVFHLTPRQMIHKARLEHAHRLLHTDMLITDVALQCGYTDHSAFSRQFKALTGFTPRQYRQATERN